MPYRRANSWGNVKPPVGTPLDWGDPINNGLVGCWLMNEGGGLYANDIARRNRGTLTSFAVPPTATSGWRPGKFGGSLAFDGTNDYVLTNLTTAMTDFTICCWFNATAGGGQPYSRLIDKSYINGTWLGRNINDNSWGGGVREGTSPYGIYVTLADGQWNQIASIRQGTTHYILGNGGTVSTSNTVSGSALDSTAVRFGYDVGATAIFLGRIDNIRIYNRALTPSEVMRLYTEPFAGLMTPRRRVISGVTAAAYQQSLTLLGVGA